MKKGHKTLLAIAVFVALLVAVGIWQWMWLMDDLDKPMNWHY